MIRYRRPFEDDWTYVTFTGPDAEGARSILTARLLAFGAEVEFFVEEEWVSSDD